MNRYFKILLSLPKTIWFNAIVFGIKGVIRCPIFIGFNVNVKQIHRGCITIEDKIRLGMIKIGINHGTEGILEGSSKGFIKVTPNSHIVFKGTAEFKEGISLLATCGGKIYFGNGFSSNRGCCISCDNLIEIDDDVMLGWNVHIRTSDGHPIYSKADLKTRLNNNMPVKIGKHVWISSNVDILKGSCIMDGCVVGFDSCVTKNFTESNVVIAGNPAKIVKINIQWERTNL